MCLIAGICFFFLFCLTHRIYLFKVQTSHGALAMASETSPSGQVKTRKSHDPLIWAQLHILPKETPNPTLLAEAVT